MQNVTFILLLQHSATEKVGNHDPLQDMQSHEAMLNHCFRKRGSLIILREITASYSIAFISKTKHFATIFYGIFRIYIKFGTFGKKSPASQVKYVRNYYLRKTWRLECIVRLLSKNVSSANVLTCRNHWTSMQNRTFILLSQYSATDKVGKHDPL